MHEFRLCLNGVLGNWQPGPVVVETREVDPNWLSWAPPVLDNPTVYEAPMGWAGPKFGPEEDVVIVMPSVPRTSSLDVRGGRNIVLIGGDNGTNRMQFLGNTGTVFVEGVRLDLSARDPIDAVQFGGWRGGPWPWEPYVGLEVPMTRPDYVFQNCHFAGVQGTNAGVHGDILQPLDNFPAGQLLIDKFSGDSSYQGFIIGNTIDAKAKGGTTGADIRRCDLRLNGIQPQDDNAYLYYFRLTDETSPHPVTLTDVWGEPRPGQAPDWWLAMPNSPRTIAAGPVGCTTGTDADGEFISWPELADIHGKLRVGTRDRFVPWDSVGLNYISPGYRPE